MSIPAGTLREHSHKTATKKPREVAPASLHGLQPLAPGAILQRAALATESLRPPDFLRLQQTLGNRATGALLNRPSGQRPIIQAKLTVNAPGDEYEREADRVADEVMRMPAVQPLATEGGMAVGAELESAISRSRGGGEPLPVAMRAPLERAFRADFGGVRVHADAQADQLNRAVQARAFTTGQDIFFRQGAYDMGSRGGKTVLAHELVHVVQQNAPMMTYTQESKGPEHVPSGPADRKDPRLEQARSPGSVQGRITTPAIQRLVGFEAELSLPTYRKLENDDVEAFLFGGYEQPYQSVGENDFFKVGPDLSRYEEDVSKIRDILLQFCTAQRDEANVAKFRGHKEKKAGTTLLEYQTKPIDELGAGSTNDFWKQFIAIKAHAAQVINEGRLGKSFQIPGPANRMLGGIPKDDLLKWNDIDFLDETKQKGVKEHLQKIENKIGDEFDIQATVGIMPSEIPGMFRRGALTTPTNQKLKEVMSSARIIIEEAVKELLELDKIKSNQWYKSISSDQVRADVFKGILYLICSYLIGHALAQTSLVDNMSEKNMVPYLSKLKAEFWYSAMAIKTDLGSESELSELANSISEQLKKKEWSKSQYWKEQCNLDRAVESRTLIFDPLGLFIKNALQGKPIKTQTGKKSFSAPEPIRAEASKPAGGQLGIQLEMRLLGETLSLTNLEQGLFKIVDEVRKISMGRMEPSDKEKLRETFEFG